MINFPNRFSGKNITILLKSNRPIDFSIFLDDDCPKVFSEQLKDINEILVTFSQMKSSINFNKDINYDEIIFKVPVKYNEKNYIYPVISFVNNKYSLIRGTLLGFKKELDYEFVRNNNNIKFNYKSLEVYIKYNNKYEFCNKNKYEILLSDFILYRNISMGNDINIKNIISLDVVNYKQYYFKKVTGILDYCIIINGVKCCIKDVFEYADDFIIKNINIIKENYNE